MVSLQPFHSVAVNTSASVYEHGWGSFSPSTRYGLADPPYRPVSERNRILNYRQSSHPAADSFFSEGVLGILDGNGAAHVIASPDPWHTGVRISATRDKDRLVLAADGGVHITSTEVAPDADDPLGQALRNWITGEAARTGITPPRTPPTGWCSWYQYYTAVTEDDIDQNLLAMAAFDLDVQVVQIDDGYERHIGDWLTPSDRFPHIRSLITRIRDSGRRAGIWIAPFLVGHDSDLAREHPQWLLRHEHGGPVHAGHNWGQDLFSLDLTHPGAAAWMTEVLTTFRSWGLDYYKADFLSAGAIPGVRYDGSDPVTAYRAGLRHLRDAIGTRAHLLGCGAPVLPSAGLVDSLRISPDTDSTYLPPDGDMSSPSLKAALVTGAGRQFMHNTIFANDPDCLITRPQVQHRTEWAAHIDRVSGAVVSSDRLRDLDDWALRTTRNHLATAAARHRDDATSALARSAPPQSNPSALGSAQPEAPQREVTT